MLEAQRWKPRTAEGPLTPRLYSWMISAVFLHVILDQRSRNQLHTGQVFLHKWFIRHWTLHVFSSAHDPNKDIRCAPSMLWCLTQYYDSETYLIPNTFFRPACLLTLTAWIYLEIIPHERETCRHQYSKATILKSKGKSPILTF